MRPLTIVIPTRNRIDKLLATLDTIPHHDWLTVHIVCDGDEATYNTLQNKIEKADIRAKYINTTLIPEHSGAVKCRNAVLENIDSDVIYATDDILFSDGAIERAAETSMLAFPNGDGVVGFVQNQSHHPTGVALVGGAFLNHYPSHHLFYPHYYHFAAQEVLWYCKYREEKEGKTFFIIEDRARLNHRHPGFNRNEMDSTHVDARIRRDSDLGLSMRREQQGLVWPLG